jgi:hypothetical protein
VEILAIREEEVVHYAWISMRRGTRFAWIRNDKYSLTSPRSVDGSLPNGETGTELSKRSCSKTLGEDVGELRACRYVKNTNLTNLNFVPDKMYVNLNVLRSTVLNWVCRQVDSRDVVTVDNSRPVNRLVQFLQKLSNPATLGNNMRDSTIFCFSARPGHG